MTVLVAPSVVRDIEREYQRLKDLAMRYIASPDRHDRWFAEAERAITNLSRDAQRHQVASESAHWGREVRRAFFAGGYRLL